MRDASASRPCWARTATGHPAPSRGSSTRCRFWRRPSTTRRLPILVSLAWAPCTREALGVAVIADLSERQTLTRELDSAAGQAGAIAHLAEAALVGADHRMIVRRAVEAVRNCLGADRASVLELGGDDRSLVLAAGCGWPPRLLGRRLSVLPGTRPDPELALAALEDHGIRSSVFDSVKIAGACVDGVDRRPERRALVAGIARMASELRIDTVAGRVQRAAERAELERLGCAYAQGFHFARPLDPEQTADALALGHVTPPSAAAPAAAAERRERPAHA